MSVLSSPVAAVSPVRSRRAGRPLRYLILRAHPGRSRADFYNCQELGLADFLRRQGFEVGVAAVFDDDARTLDPELRVHQLQFRPRHPAIALIANLRALDLPEYDIVQLSDLCLPGNLQVMWRAPKGTRFLLYQGHYPEPVGRARWLRVWQSRLAAVALRARPHVLLAKNSSAAEFLLRCGLGPVPVAGAGLVAENLLAPRPLPPVVSAFLDRRRFTFLYVGQLNERRPLEWVLPHLRAPELAHASLLVIGSGPALSRLRAEGADLAGAGRLLFAGNLSQSQLGAVYRRVHALVLPSRYEIFGMVCLEAVLFGLPVIASHVAGPTAVADRFPHQVQLVAQGPASDGWRFVLAATARQPANRTGSEPDPALVRALSWETPGQHFLRGIDQLLARQPARTEDLHYD